MVNIGSGAKKIFPQQTPWVSDQPGQNSVAGNADKIASTFVQWGEAILSALPAGFGRLCTVLPARSDPELRLEGFSLTDAAESLFA